MSHPKNIQEFVVSRVVQHLQERDEEFQRMQKEIEHLKAGIRRSRVSSCSSCNGWINRAFTDAYLECVTCQSYLCENCCNMEEYLNDGDWTCDDCILENI